MSIDFSSLSSRYDAISTQFWVVKDIKMALWIKDFNKFLESDTEYLKNQNQFISVVDWSRGYRPSYVSKLALMLWNLFQRCVCNPTLTWKIQKPQLSKNCTFDYGQVCGQYPISKKDMPNAGSGKNYPRRNFTTLVEYTAESVQKFDCTKKSGGWADPEDVNVIGTQGDPRTKQGEYQDLFHGRPMAEREQYAMHNAQKKFKKLTIDSVSGRPLFVHPVTSQPIQTGMTGRGSLGKWGPNFAADNLLTRINRETGKIQVATVKRVDTGEYAITGGMVDPGEDVGSAAIREMLEEALGLPESFAKSLAVAVFAANKKSQALNEIIAQELGKEKEKYQAAKEKLNFEESDCLSKLAELEKTNPSSYSQESLLQTVEFALGIFLNPSRAFMGYRGPVDDPRNTNNAWVETSVVHFHLKKEEVVALDNLRGSHEGTCQWIDLDQLQYANHKEIAITTILQNKTVWEESISQYPQLAGSIQQHLLDLQVMALQGGYATISSS